MKINFLLFLFIILAGGVSGQTPQKQELKRTRFDPPTEINGFKVRYATLSKGKYQEIFSNDTIQQIGSVLFNRLTGEVVGEVIKDSLYFPADVVSRWWSIDPLAGKFPEQSPYVFSNNNPILFIDPDGMAAIPYTIKNRLSATQRAYLNNVALPASKTLSNLYNKIDKGQHKDFFVTMVSTAPSNGSRYIVTV
jgi:hypothetical protein